MLTSSALSWGTNGNKQSQGPSGSRAWIMACPQSSSKIFLTVTLSLPKRAGPLNLVEKLTIRLYCGVWGRWTKFVIAILVTESCCT